MKPLELARQLAKSLAESEEFRAYQEAKKVLNAHEAARVMLEDFRKKQWEVEEKRLRSEQSLESAENELRKLAEIIGLNPYVREYLRTEYQFSQLLMEVQKIIGDAVGLTLPEAAGGSKN